MGEHEDYQVTLVFPEIQVCPDQREKLDSKVKMDVLESVAHEDKWEIKDQLETQVIQERVEKKEIEVMMVVPEIQEFQVEVEKVDQMVCLEDPVPPELRVLKESQDHQVHVAVKENP